MIKPYTLEEIFNKYTSALVAQGIGDTENGVPFQDLVQMQVSVLSIVQRRVLEGELPLSVTITAQPDFEKYMNTMILLLAEDFAKLIEAY